jgi:Tol biopolymer transport system component
MLAKRTAAALVAALLGTLALGGTAHATYPGRRDGLITYAMNVDGNVDLYSTAPNGRGLRRLTDSAAFDGCPSYSADGRSLAFCSGTLGGAIEIWTMREDGSRAYQVSHLGGSASFPDFSPDGRRIVFGAITPTAADPASSHLFVVNRDGSGLVQLTAGAPSDAFPAWSPDGRRVAFIRDGQVWTMRANGSDSRQITSDPAPKDQLPDWSPDGRRIAYMSGGDIWVMNADGGRQRPLFADPTTVEFAPNWSPTGRQISFVSLHTLADRTVEVANADGTCRHVLRAGPGFQLAPAWQPIGWR